MTAKGAVTPDYSPAAGHDEHDMGSSAGSAARPYSPKHAAAARGVVCAAASPPRARSQLQCLHCVLYGDPDDPLDDGACGRTRDHFVCSVRVVSARRMAPLEELC